MPVVTRRQLLEAGVHFGHQTRRWNPKMRRFIFGERSGIYIIDLEKSLSGLQQAYESLVEMARKGGSVLFVGTKKQAQETVAEQATRVNMPYVNTRWLGGMLTNFQTIYGRLRRLKELRDMERSGAFEFLPKKEVLKLRHEKEKLERNLSGIQDMERLPAAVFVIDTKREHIAVKEARKLGIPVVAIVDTNADPDEVDFVIPGNDDAIRACSLITKVIADAIQEGQYLAYQGMQDRAAGVTAAREPAPAASFAAVEEEGRPRVVLSEEEAAFFGLNEEAPASGVVPEAPAEPVSAAEPAPAAETVPAPAPDSPESEPDAPEAVETSATWAAPVGNSPEESRTEPDVAGPLEEGDPETIDAEFDQRFKEELATAEEGPQNAESTLAADQAPPNLEPEEKPSEDSAEAEALREAKQ